MLYDRLQSRQQPLFSGLAENLPLQIDSDAGKIVVAAEFDITVVAECDFGAPEIAVREVYGDVFCQWYRYACAKLKTESGMRLVENEGRVIDPVDSDFGKADSGCDIGLDTAGFEVVVSVDLKVVIEK
jgi:hypothetical protein